MKAGRYGVALYRAAVVVRTDGRRRGWKECERVTESGEVERYQTRVALPGNPGGRGERGEVTEWTVASRKRLRFKLENFGGSLLSAVTLTYHARCDEGDTEAVKLRNAKLVRRAKRDLHHWLVVLRQRYGAVRYAWVQEFQQRGAVHFHLLVDVRLLQDWCSETWCRVTGQALDNAARRHAVRVTLLDNGHAAAAKYAHNYAGKAAQKSLPLGVAGAGRWWGTSRDWPLELIEEVLSGLSGHEGESFYGQRVTRQMRRWLRSVMPWKFRSGVLFMWKGLTLERCRSALEMSMQWASSGG